VERYQRPSHAQLARRTRQPMLGFLLDSKLTLTSNRTPARGQWDPVGGLWDESDTDIPSGEGLARSFLLGQRYFKSKFGKYAITGWLPDSFGHTWQLPQIMQLAGIRYFYHMRCGNGMEFTWWEAPDGSRVLKANTQPYDAKPKLEQLIVPMKNESRFGLPQSLVIFGVGDHGGGPTREQILRIQSFQRDPIFPRIHFISADAFFDQLAKEPATASLPVVDSGLQYVFTGCYTTHADMKKDLRRSENDLYSAEVLSSLAAMMGQPYPVDGFNEAWKPTAFAQFHDIAAGSAIHSTYDWMHEQLAPAFQFQQEQTDKSLRFLAANCNTRGPGTNAIVVWNTLSFARDDVVSISIAGAKQYHSVADNQGRRFPAQAGDSNTLVFIARNVPAFGHAIYFPEVNSCPADGAVLRDDGDVYEVQTPNFTLQINKATGTIAQLYSKTAKWNVFGDARDADAWQLLGDSGTSWTIRYTGTDQILTNEEAKVSVVEQGPVFDRVRVTRAVRQSSYTQDLTVYGALPRIDVPTTVNWQEEHELLKIRLPVNATTAEANAQIPFGSTIYPTIGQECPGQKWMDISEVTPASGKPCQTLHGLSVLNDCKYGFDVSSNVFRLTALRSAPKPDPHPDQGMQTFTYSLYPHAGDWRAAHTDEKALALNIPLLAIVTQPHPPARPIPSFSLANTSAKGDLIVMAVKHSEDGDGFILRFYEADGQDTRARIDFDRPVRVRETDLLERPLAKHPITTQGNSVMLPVGHNQIITLHVTFEPSQTGSEI
jgi:alpha-mannosidase